MGTDPPQLSDLDGFAFEHQDIEELKTCKVGHCEVQLATEAIAGSKLRGASPTDPAYAVAEKQIYAVYNFEMALDLTVCIKDAQGAGFYIITVKGSKQAGPTGLKGN